MMFYRFLVLATCVFGAFVLKAQNSTIYVDQVKHDYGDLENIYTLKSEFIIKNNGVKNLYLMRADAEKDVKILAHKKTIPAGDTTLIEVFYQPAKTGKFQRKISLATSADGLPFVLEISGNIKSIKTDDKTACYYFGKPKHTKTDPVVIPTKPIQTVTYKPVNKDTIIDGFDTITGTVIETTPVEVFTANDEGLSRFKYEPNNIVFLLDVSRSMRDSSRLPLLKKAIMEMITNLRDIDKISIVTYADSILLKCEAFPGTERDKLKNILDPLYAKGYTRGAKAVLFSLDIALKNYINEGNNQLFLATDGKFTFSEAYQKEWTKKTMGKDVVLSVVGLGNDEEAMKNLKQIAEFGKGSFIHIKDFEKDKILLIDEIKLRSERK
ncbi:MAG: VWA domain-containing protein [Bacteroidetes bacterium]|nr:VWA domain-containing protein [Bacteroidota bacterium]